jgi:hypothetical protein
VKRRTLALAALLAAGMALWIGLPPAAPAAIAAPLARQNDPAGWTVGAPTVESIYPAGMIFRLRAESSGGPIVRARLVWYRPVLRPGAIRRVQVEEARIDAGTGELVAVWQPDGLIMLPPWSVVAYHWELRDAAGSDFETGPQTAEYADHTRPWIRSESRDAIVFASDLPGDVDRLILDALAAQRERYEAVWGAALPYAPRIVLFGDYGAWLEWRTADRSTSRTEVVVGQTFDAWGVIAQVLTGFPSEPAYRELAYSTVLHEMEHLYQAEFLSGRRQADVPGWFYEGDATFFEIEQSYDYLGRVRALAAAGDLPALLVGLADAPQVSGRSPRLGYDIGYSFFEWLRESTGGLEAHRAIMALLGEDVPFFDALEQALGRSTGAIERDWRVWLGASEAAPTLVPTWTPLPFFATPTPFVYGG